MTKAKEIFEAFHEHIIPIVLGCIIFPSVYWLSSNVDNPDVNPYVRGGTLNPIHKAPAGSPQKNATSARQNPRIPTGMPASSLVFAL